MIQVLQEAVWIKVLWAGEGDAEARHRTRGEEPLSYDLI